MKKKQLILIAVAVILVLIWLAMGLTQNKTTRLPKFDKLQALDRIETGRNGTLSYAVVLSNQQWWVEPIHFLADPYEVGEMLKLLTNFTVSDLVTENGIPEQYELTAENRLELAGFLNGSMVRHIYIGKKSPTLKHTYVLLPNDRNIYQAKGDFNNVFQKRPIDIAQRAIVSIDPTNIISVNIQEGANTWYIKKGETTTSNTQSWYGSWKTSPLNEPISIYMIRIANVTAAGLVRPEGTIKKNLPFIRKFTITTETKVLEYTILKEMEGKDYKVTVDGIPYVFIVREDSITPLLQDLNKF